MRTIVKAARKRQKTVKLRTNGKHKIDAASTISAPIGNMGRILRPQALFRWLGPQLAAITPTYIEQTMLGAMAGSTLQAWSLFDLMLKTWPELLACYQELIESVIRKKLVYEPYCEEDEKPTPSAIEKQKVVATALRRMQPDPTRDDSDLEATIRDILDAWFRGVAVSEIVWQKVDDKQVGTIMAPKSTFAVDPTNYGFAADGSLGIRSKKSKDAGVWPYSTTSLMPAPDQLTPFPDNKFLIAMHKASGGSPLGGALLRPLAWWWCAANFSSDWLLNLAQLFGLPFRWVTYDTSATSDTIAAIDQMLQNMGSNGWARFPVGTTMEMLQTGKEGSDHSPQGELLDRADRYARSLILGQTMTGNHGSTGKGGGQAFGKVEMEVKSDRVDAAGKFAVQVINQQLVPSILMLNYGDTDEMPQLKFLEDEVADLTEAQRDKTLADAGLEIGVDYLRKKYDIPEPADGEDVIGGAKPAPSFGGFGNQNFGNQDPNSPDAENPTETKDPNEESDMQGRTLCDVFMDEIQAEEEGHPFRGNQYVHFAPGDVVDTPHGKGRVRQVHSDNLQVVMDEHKPGYPIRSVMKSEATKIPGPEVIKLQSRLKELRSEESKYLTVSRGSKNMIKSEEIRLQIANVRKQLADSGFPDLTLAQKRQLRLGIQSSDQTGHPFRGNQYVTFAIGNEVETRYGRGIVKSVGENGAWVNIDGKPHWVKQSEMTHSRTFAIGNFVHTPYGPGKIKSVGTTSAWVSIDGRLHSVKLTAISKGGPDTYGKPFPSLLPSEENKRRLMRNAGLQTKLLELNEIEDDAVFSRELLQLTEGLK